MKKNLLFLVFILFISIFLVGCGKEVYTEGISSFKYQFGSYNGGYYYYDISVKDDKVIYKAQGSNGVDLNINKEIDKKYLEELNDILNDNQVNLWDGFDKRDDSIMDGASFTLEVKYSDGKKLKALGYMKYPKNYDEAHEKIFEFLKGIK